MSNPTPAPNDTIGPWERRQFMAVFAGTGLAATLLPGALAAQAEDAAEITPDMVRAAAKIAGLELPAKDIDQLAEQLNGRRSPLQNYQKLREMKLANSVPLSIVFNPLPAGYVPPMTQRSLRLSKTRVRRPSGPSDVAFLSVRELGELLRRKRISSTELTKIYLERLHRHNERLNCVVSFTDELAHEQAAQADKEIRAGRYRGPLHGIPWGLKDLFAVKGYRTTWGAEPFKEQVIDQNSSIFNKLTDAGAVLIAKLTTGAFANGDRWFGGQTKNPWDPENPERGSSGSSAGPSAATVAGLVGFGIGTETLGSIISPSSRCGASGLRPTFGRVSRHGGMALSWTMDKVGPICRNAEDCAIVLNAIHGPDGYDRACLTGAFNWDAGRDPKPLRIGYLKSLVEGDIPDNPENPERARRAREQRGRNQEALNILRGLGMQLRPVELPEMPTRAIGFVLGTEAAAAFDYMREEGMEGRRIRSSRFAPAVEYIQANRARSQVIETTDEFFKDLDLFIGSDLRLTNLTGHPEVCIPNGFDSKDQPLDLRITGKLFGEEELLMVAHAFQEATDFHKKRPGEFS